MGAIWVKVVMTNRLISYHKYITVFYVLTKSIAKRMSIYQSHGIYRDTTLVVLYFQIVVKNICGSKLI